MNPETRGLWHTPHSTCDMPFPSPRRCLCSGMGPLDAAPNPRGGAHSIHLAPVAADADRATPRQHLPPDRKLGGYEQLSSRPPQWALGCIRESEYPVVDQQTPCNRKCMLSVMQCYYQPGRQARPIHASPPPPPPPPHIPILSRLNTDHRSALDSKRSTKQHNSNCMSEQRAANRTQVPTIHRRCEDSGPGNVEWEMAVRPHKQGTQQVQGKGAPQKCTDLSTASRRQQAHTRGRTQGLFFVAKTQNLLCA
jgi:hypothetical protein